MSPAEVSGLQCWLALVAHISCGEHDWRAWFSLGFSLLLGAAMVRTCLRPAVCRVCACCHCGVDYEGVRFSAVQTTNTCAQPLNKVIANACIFPGNVCDVFSACATCSVKCPLHENVAWPSAHVHGHFAAEGVYGFLPYKQETHVLNLSTR